MIEIRRRLQTMLGVGLTIPEIAVRGTRVSGTPANAYVAEDGTTFYVAEDGTTFYVQENGVNTLNIVAVGDSITSTDFATRPYPSFLSVLFGVSNTNLGVPGIGLAWNTSGVKAPVNLISSAASLVDPLLTPPIPWLILLAGTNDFNYGDTPAQIYASFQTWITARLADGWPANRIIICTVPPHSVWEAQRPTYNALLVAGAGTYGYQLARIDLDPNIGQAGDNLNTRFYSDGTHPTNAGHAIIAAIIAAVIAP
jgi:lysophospholipase L1-like esterase